MKPEKAYFEQYRIWRKLGSQLLGLNTGVVYERTLPRFPFFVEYRNQGRVKSILGSGRDLSEDGIRFATGKAPRRGEVVHLIMYFPKEFRGGGTLELRGRVFHAMKPSGRRRWRVGCQFLETSSVDRNRLQEFLAWNFERG